MSLAERKHAAVASKRLSLSEFIPYRIAVLGRRISGSLAKRYERIGISIPEWRAIAHLAEVGTCSSGDICARTAMDKAKVNRAVTRLVAIGLILAGTSSRDRRVNTLKLTAKGRRTYEEIAPLALELQSVLLEPLSPSELAEFMRTLGKLQAQVAKWTTTGSSE
jgi:DNA-binding MarR family transcriptional regulator